MLPSDSYRGQLEDWQPVIQESPTVRGRPEMATLLNTEDFQKVAQKSMGHAEYVYYSSAAEDEFTVAENQATFKNWRFRPRILVDVSNVDTSTTILGFPTAYPLFLSASALSGLAHPEAELALARATKAVGVPQMVPTVSSRTHEEIASARPEGHIQFFQLYVNRDHEVTKSLVKKVEALGYQAIFLTVDTPFLGRRESDLRNTFGSGNGVIRSLGTLSDPSLTWDFVDWLMSITTLPIVLKGVQRGDDSQTAARHGVAGILVSNHGGRQLDGARASLDVLEEVIDSLGPQTKMEVYLDGGIRRGSDIVKALALGARAVGVTRPVIYGLAGYGEEGAKAVLSLLHEETKLCMALCGAPDVGRITRDLIVRKPTGNPTG